MSLVINNCSYEAARYAVLHWHYSQAMPVGKLIKYGTWENGVFIGAVLFGRGVNRNIGKPYKLGQHEVCELVRVALTRHDCQVTKIISQCISLIKKNNPRLRLIVSYADSSQDHTGIIYQAGNWIYTSGSTEPNLFLNGKQVHGRSVGAKYGTRSLSWLKDNVDKSARYEEGLPKYKYLYPLDKKMRKQIMPLSKQYPKAV